MWANVLQIRCLVLTAALFLVLHVFIVSLNASQSCPARSSLYSNSYSTEESAISVLFDIQDIPQRIDLSFHTEKTMLHAVLTELFMLRAHLFIKAREQDVNLVMRERYAQFDDVVGLYELLRMSYATASNRELIPSAILQDVPFERLVASVSYPSIKEAITYLRQGNPALLVRIIDKENSDYSEAEKRSAWACCLVMLIAVCNTVVDVQVHIRGIASCINLIQIYEHVEQLPIENVLQAMHMLLYRIGVMLDSMSQKEEGFVGWLKNKWVYLPVTVLIIAMRIAKYYWGSNHIFSSYTGGNQWNGVSQFGNDGSFGLHNLLFETRIKEGDSKF